MAGANCLNHCRGNGQEVFGRKADALRRAGGTGSEGYPRRPHGQMRGRRGLTVRSPLFGDTIGDQPRTASLEGMLRLFGSKEQRQREDRNARLQQRKFGNGLLRAIIALHGRRRADAKHVPQDGRIGPDQLRKRGIGDGRSMAGVQRDAVRMG